MTLEILLATMNRTDMDFIDKSIINLVHHHSSVSLLVINQCISVPPTLSVSTNKIRIISVGESGLSRSRNLALREAVGDICLIADDDCMFYENTCDIILNNHIKYNDAVITFCLNDRHSERRFKKYFPITFRNNKFTIGRISSCEITFKRKNLVEKGISFNNDFGLGAKYGLGGEENILLAECLDKNLTCRFIPEVICATPAETLTRRITKESGIITGMIVRRIFRNYLSGLLYLFLSNIIKIRWLPFREFVSYSQNLLRGYHNVNKQV